MVELLAAGLTYKQIAPRVGLGVSSVRTHLHNIYGKLEVIDRAQAVLECVRKGWVVLDADEVAVQRSLADATRNLATLVRHRQELTPAQAAYLRAFDELLYANTEIALARAERLMGAALGPVLGEAGVTPSGTQRHRGSGFVRALAAIAREAA